MHYFAVEKAVQAKYGEMAFLVKDPDKVAHYCATLGEPVDNVQADTKQCTFEYFVFIAKDGRVAPVAPTPAKPFVPGTQKSKRTMTEIHLLTHGADLKTL